MMQNDVPIPMKKCTAESPFFNDLRELLKKHCGAECSEVIQDSTYMGLEIKVSEEGEGPFNPHNPMSYIQPKREYVWRFSVVFKSEDFTYRDLENEEGPERWS